MGLTLKLDPNIRTGCGKKSCRILCYSLTVGLDSTVIMDIPDKNILQDSASVVCFNKFDLLAVVRDLQKLPIYRVHFYYLHIPSIRFGVM